MGAARAVATAGAAAAAAITAHTAVNLRLVRAPAPGAHVVHERVTVLLPLRNEATRVTPALRALLAQTGLPDLEILVLDDGSTDGTADVVRTAIDGDPRVKILDGGHEPLPDGWLGKAWACHRLSLEATGDVLVFIDADVVLAPGAIAATVSMMRTEGLDLLSPYPLQRAEGLLERATQPLVTWSWLATMPLYPAEHTHYPSLAAAIGQLLVVDADAYRASGGHTSVRDVILEDVGVLRALKRHGFRGVPAIGGEIAECRMYEGAEEVIEGYTKSLWSAFGSTPGALGALGVMAVAYLLPPAFALAARDRRTRIVGAAGYLAGVAGRALVARRTGERVWPDTLAHPLSVGAFAALTLVSLRRKRAGTLTWRGRSISA